MNDWNGLVPVVGFCVGVLEQSVVVWSGGTESQPARHKSIQSLHHSEFGRSNSLGFGDSSTTRSAMNDWNDLVLGWKDASAVRESPTASCLGKHGASCMVSVSGCLKGQLSWCLVWVWWRAGQQCKVCRC